MAHSSNSDTSHKKIIYLNPSEQMKLKNMSDDWIKMYYNKLKIFKCFKPSNKITWKGQSECDVQSEYGIYKTMTDDESDKCDNQTFLVGKKSPCTSEQSYMYSFKCDVNLDELDKKFVETQNADKIIDLFGYHTYGDYYGFFRPDIVEVIHMLHCKIPPKDLDQIERIYVTTEPYPKSDFEKCFDAKKDMHRGKTSCYIYYKTKKYDENDCHHNKKQKL